MDGQGLPSDHIPIRQSSNVQDNIEPHVNSKTDQEIGVLSPTPALIQLKSIKERDCVACKKNRVSDERGEVLAW